MSNTNQPTQKIFNLTAYEISVLFRGLLQTFNATTPEVLDKIRDSAPWRAVLDTVQTAQLETIKDAEKSGDFEALLESYLQQLNTIKN